MHEYSLIEALVRRVEEEAARRQATRIHGIRVSLGELAGVDPELFRTAYQMFREGTACAGAALEVIQFAARWTCPRCGRAFARGEVLRCGPCAAPAQLDEKSEALLLEAIDMEVP